MLQLITIASVLVIVCSAILLVYTVCMCICFKDMRNIIMHKKHVHVAYTIVRRQQHIVDVHDTAIVCAYRPWMNMLLAEYGIERTSNDDYTTHMVGNCPVYVYNK